MKQLSPSVVFSQRSRLPHAAALAPLPYAPGRWVPPAVVLGEAHKGTTAAHSAHRAAELHAAALLARRQRQFPGNIGNGEPVPSIPVPPAVTEQEQCSRHEAAVVAVRFHPRAAVLASASSTVAWWLSPES